MVSTKPGQSNLKKALEFKKHAPREGVPSAEGKKQAYLFIGNNIETSEFENFPQIQAWVNTACRRLDMNDSSIINLDTIKWE